MPWEKTEGEIRHRLQEPGLFEPDSFRRKEIADGVSLILGKKKGQQTMEAQAIRFDKDKFDMAKAKEWVKAHPSIQKNHSDDVKLHEIVGMEIFEAGTWNGDTYTEADLDEIVKAHSEIGAIMKPYLKLGHNDEQELLKNDGLPAAGWLQSLRREGKKLVADFVGVPQKIYELVKRKAYARRSAEIIWNLKIGDKTYPYALKAVALLGGETPAVHTLDDALALYAACGEATAYSDDIVSKEYEYEPKQDESQKDETQPMQEKSKEDEQMEKEIEALKAKNSELEKKASEIERQFADLKAVHDSIVKENCDLKSKYESAEKKVFEFNQKALVSEATAKVEKLIADKKIVPAQKDAAFTILMAAKSNQEKQYDLGDKKLSMDELIEKLFSDAAVVTLPTEISSETGKSSAINLAKAAKEYAEKNGISLKEATIIVSREIEKKPKA